MTADRITNNHLLLGNMLQRMLQLPQTPWFLTKFGDRSDWKWKRTPALAIWSSHLLLASHVSISFSLLLSNIWFKAARSCSEKAQTVATRLWQKTMSLRSCGSLSAIRENRGVLRNGVHQTSPQARTRCLLALALDSHQARVRGWGSEWARTFQQIGFFENTKHPKMLETLK